jgi:hypothetical protein
MSVLASRLTFVCMYQVAGTALAATGETGHLTDANLLAVGCLRYVLWILFHSSGRLSPSCINNTPSRTRLKSLSHRVFRLDYG